jgi:uncharacterized protein (DUF58 family)
MASPLLDLALLAQAETLEWRSRVLVEGFLLGSHRSRLRGFSSEFSQYNPYMQGDDLRYVDWRAFGRLDRLYIRQFEAETNLRCQILLDASASMGYQSEGVPFTKFGYASLLAAALMRILQRQHDAFGLSLARTKLVEHLPPRVTRLHFFRCLGAMEKAQPEGMCQLKSCVDALAELFPKRGLVFVFTDTWDDLDQAINALQRLRFDFHEVCLLQVVDPRELDFSFSESHLFEDMETGLKLPITPDWNRKNYLEEVRKHQDSLTKACRDLGVSHYLLQTTQSPFEALTKIVAEREKLP